MARIPRIPAPVVDRLPPPVVEAIEPPVVEFTPPPVLTPNPPSIDVPDFDPPSYEPIDVPERPPNNPPRMGRVSSNRKRKRKKLTDLSLIFQTSPLLRNDQLSKFLSQGQKFLYLIHAR